MSPIWFYALFLFLGACALLGMGLTAIFNRRTSMSVYFALFCLTVSIYAFGYGMEVTRADETALRFWSRFQYMGMPFISSFLIIFVAHYVGSGKRIHILVNSMPVLASTVFLLVRQTNHIHHQFYNELYFHDLKGFMVMTFDKGLWYWIFAVYNISCIIASAILIGMYLAGAPKVRVRQALWLLLGVVMPFIPYLVHVLGLISSGIDIIPAAIVISSFSFFIAVFRHNLFSLVPIGRDRLVENMVEAVFVLNTDGQVADVNPAGRKAFLEDGYDPIGRSLEEVLPSLVSLENEARLIEQDGRIWEMTKVSVKSRRKIGGYLIIGHDVTEREELVARLARAAREDALTGLLNRHSWDEAVSTELARLSRHGRFGSVIYLDLDGFKAVNDSHGHAAGDSVLRAVGRVLKEGVRRPDLIGRYGGEEFVLFLPEIHPEAAVDVAERLRVDLYEEIKADMSVDVAVTGSFGVAGGIIADDVSLEELVGKADKAMYESKKSGKNSVSWNRH